MARKFPIRDDFEPLFFDEMGRLVVAAGRLEYVLKLCLKQLVGKGFTAGMLEAEQIRQLPCLCDKVVAQAKNKLTGLHLSNLEALIDGIKPLAVQRNDIVHALWTTADSREPLRIRPELQREKGSKSVDWSKGKVVHLSELRRLRRQMEEAHAALQCQRKIWN